MHLSKKQRRRLIEYLRKSSPQQGRRLTVTDIERTLRRLFDAEPHPGQALFILIDLRNAWREKIAAALYPPRLDDLLGLEDRQIQQSAFDRRIDILREVVDTLMSEQPDLDRFHLPRGYKQTLFERCAEHDEPLFNSVETFNRHFWQSAERKEICALAGHSSAPREEGT